jgi:beta-fructofuranosidase
MASSDTLNIARTSLPSFEKEIIVSVSSVAWVSDTKPDPSTRWRPRLHLTAARGWINDPCGPGYDPVSDIYHLGFQWNPNETEWGNISWGAALSHDLLSWKISDRPSMQPSSQHDPGGVFSGCLVPTAIDGQANGNLTAIYTSVSRLPIHHTLPYFRTSEAVALATSTNSGITWTRNPNRIIVSQPPAGLDVTGWRDPYVRHWPAMNKISNQAPRESELEPLYAIVAGGIRAKGPTAFLYRVNAHALDQWQYLGVMFAPRMNYCPSPRWTGDFGLNWEVSNFLSLSSTDHSISRDFLICGVEGRLATAEAITRNGSMRATNAQMWICGSLGTYEGSWMEYRYGGKLDHGTYYAGNSFWDPKVQQQVIFGWLLEDDLTPELRTQQGWAGVISLPRVLKLHILRSVTGALQSPLQSIGSVELVPDDENESCFTVVSLCAVPDERRCKLRGRHISSSKDGLVIFPEVLAQWEMKLVFVVDTDAIQLGFDIIHSTSKTTRCLDIQVS